jgi:hypothetical protein
MRSPAVGSRADHESARGWAGPRDSGVGPAVPVSSRLAGLVPAKTTTIPKERMTCP